jgi:mannose-6-phosphate isomerase-like protein (cupin superfamily)
MTVYDTTNRTPYALAQGEGEALWFLGSLQTIKASAASTGGRLTIIEARAVEGPASPLHVHHKESEWWYVLEGELAIWAAGEVIEAPAGSFVYGPVGVPHTFSVVSAQARFLLGTEPAGFEAFMRACSEPAQSPTLPPPGTTTPDPARMAALGAEYGIEVLGPPGLPA